MIPKTNNNIPSAHMLKASYQASEIEINYEAEVMKVHPNARWERTGEDDYGSYLAIMDDLGNNISDNCYYVGQAWKSAYQYLKQKK